MRNLKENQLEQIKKMVEEKKSLNAISKELVLSKTTVYYWFKKFGGYQIPKINLDLKSNEKIGEFVGIFAGDGSYTIDKDYRHIITISLNFKDFEYICSVAELIEGVCGKKAWIYNEESRGVSRVRIISKETALLMKQYLDWGENKTHTIRLKKELEKYSKEFVIGFLRGLLDTDGWIGDKILKYSTISFPLARNIELLLKFLDIHCKGYVYYEERGNRKPIYRIVVSKDFTKFLDIVKPKHFNHLSPN